LLQIKIAAIPGLIDWMGRSGNKNEKKVNLLDYPALSYFSRLWPKDYDFAVIMRDFKRFISQAYPGSMDLGMINIRLCECWVRIIFNLLYIC
jgi:hypothetical protein